MKKRVLATILTVCLLFSVMACVAGAQSNLDVEDIVSSIRICPGKVINDDVIEAPEVSGYYKVSGWEIQTVDGIWLPYDGESIGDDVIGLRYYAVDYSGNYERSNECSVRVEHNPIGDYQYSGTDHWRVCDDCGGQADKGGHTHLGGSATANEKVCSVCGHVRTSQYTGLLSFWEWLFPTVIEILAIFGITLG